MNKGVSAIITDTNITVNFNGETHIVARSEPLADKLIQAIKAGRKDDIPGLVSAAKRIEHFGKGDFQVKDGRVMVKGVAVPDYLSRRILSFQEQGLPHTPLVRFAEALQRNPSYRAVQELFQFLEKNNHPITDTGCFIAYKKVRSDMMDIYSGTFDNSVGKVVEMPRNQVNEDPNQTCSNGLHVANWDYAHNHYGSGSDTMLEVVVDPADVVAVPVDYNQTKMRVCRYVVLGVVTQPHADGTELRSLGLTPSADSMDGCEPDEEEEENEEECGECGTCECEKCGPCPNHSDNPRDACEDEEE